MPKRTSSYRDFLLANLTDPTEAANYLSSAEDEGPDRYVAALRDVALARKLGNSAPESAPRLNPI